MTTYTIISGEGEMIATGLSLREAAHEILTSDGRSYEVREHKGLGFALWSRQQVANRGWQATRFLSHKTDRTEAEHEIFSTIVASQRFPGHSEAITDEQYADIVAQSAENDA